jgi:hypothetical protein
MGGPAEGGGSGNSSSGRMSLAPPHSTHDIFSLRPQNPFTEEEVCVFVCAWLFVKARTTSSACDRETHSLRKRCVCLCLAFCKDPLTEEEVCVCLFVSGFL